jgi:hypothetical protein
MLLIAAAQDLGDGKAAVSVQVDVEDGAVELFPLGSRRRIQRSHSLLKQSRPLRPAWLVALQ